MKIFVRRFGQAKWRASRNKRFRLSLSPVRVELLNGHPFGPLAVKDAHSSLPVQLKGQTF
jgi:hypothetical protein